MDVAILCSVFVAVMTAHRIVIQNARTSTKTTREVGLNNIDALLALEIRPHPSTIVSLSAREGKNSLHVCNAPSPAARLRSRSPKKSSGPIVISKDGGSFGPAQSAKPQISPLRSPGFPGEVDGVDEVHALFFGERRTRSSVWCSVTGNPGSPRS
jgi:hypothetical protein